MYQFRPLIAWPGKPTSKRLRAPFRVSYDKTLRELVRELNHLGARNLVIQAAVDEKDIRLDGMLRSGVSPRHPGVILSFDSKHGPLSWAIDTYQDYRDNIRAIGLTLEALRRVDRYGGTKRAEQYAGWKALPGPVQAPETMSRDEALQTLLRFASMPPGAPADLGVVWRHAQMNTHPDRDGKQADFELVQRAATVLGIKGAES